MAIAQRETGLEHQLDVMVQVRGVWRTKSRVDSEPAGYVVLDSLAHGGGAVTLTGECLALIGAQLEFRVDRFCHRRAC